MRALLVEALEAQLLHSERLSSIGTLAAGVAHELNNPLTLVLCNLSDLSRTLPSLTPQVAGKTLDHLDLGAVGKVRATETHITQLVLNLVLNAIDAMDELPRGQPRIASIRLCTDKGEVGIQVSDSGPGIAKELRELIFTPFFSTTPRGRGTGLGLTVAKTIVEGLSGTLRVIDSEQGSTFEARLPALH